MKRLCILGGVELRFHWTVVPGLLLWLLLGAPLELLGAGAALLLHEWAHALTARGLGAQVEGMELYPFGACVRMEAGGAVEEELLIALAGPLCGTAAAGMTLLAERLFPQGEGVLRPFFQCNLGLSLINLLPGYPLDGGRCLVCLLKKRLGETGAVRLGAWSGIALGVGLLALGLWGLMQGQGNGSMLLFAFFLFLGAGRELIALPENRLLDFNRRHQVLKRGRTVDVHQRAVGEGQKIGEAIKLLRQGEYTLLWVVDGRGRVLGTLDEGRLMEAAARFGRDKVLKDILPSG